MQNYFDFDKLLIANHSCSSGWWGDRLTMKPRSLAKFTMQSLARYAKAEVVREQKKVLHKPIWTGRMR